MSSVQKKAEAVNDTLAKGMETSTEPSDNVPDNYVQHTLRTQKALPPFRWNIWWKEINWLNFAILIITPIIGFIGMYFTHLQLKTFIFAVIYYYITGLGKQKKNKLSSITSTVALNGWHSRNHRRISSTLGTSVIQCISNPAVLPSLGRCWRR